LVGSVGLNASVESVGERAPRMVRCRGYSTAPLKIQAFYFVAVS
jgi:hypothetical protein